MSEVDNVYVRRGLWTDFSRGDIMGMTITTDTRTGTVVVAVLAILSSLATTHLWHIITFALHQIRARGKPEDGLFWQQQAILRTLPSPSSLLADNVNLWWGWRAHTKRPFLRCLTQVALPFIFTLITIAATVSTSYIVDTSNIEVLVDSPFCGQLNRDNSAPKDYMSKVSNLALSYRDECYQEGVSIPTSCRNNYVKPRIPVIYNGTECPFDSSMCQKGSNPAVSMDTGLLDLNDALGFNLKKSDSVKIRKKTTCTVVPFEGHYKISTLDKDIEPGNAMTYAVAGPRFTYGDELLLAFYGTNQDYVEFENATFVFPVTRRIGITHSGSFTAWAGDPEPMWSPMPELARTDADVVITMVPLNGTYFETPVDDPFYSAHKNRTVGDMTIYVSDLPAGVLGCTEQYQYCIGQKSKPDFCTKLTGAMAEISSFDFPSPSPIQLAALELSRSVFLASNMEQGIYGGFNATGALWPSPGLPADQWIVESLFLEKYVFSMMQILFTDYAIGPEARSPIAKDSVTLAASEGEKALCSIQKMRKAGGFANINYFGVVFITVVSFLLIIFDLGMLKGLMLLSRFRRALAPRLDRWFQDGVLQLQRQAFEAQGKGNWEKLDDEVPVTRFEEKLSGLSKTSPMVMNFRTQSTWATTGTDIKEGGSSREGSDVKQNYEIQETERKQGGDPMVQVTQ